MAQNTQTNPKTKTSQQAPVPTNEHNEREHQERLARQQKNLEDGAPGGNEHNRREHEEKMKREGGS